MAEEQVAGWTIGKLNGLSVADRHKLWKNARMSKGADGPRLMAMIEDCGLPFSDDACLRMNDPVTMKIWEIVNTAESKAACLQATADGLPAMAGVDAHLNQVLGVDYRGANMATVTAGSFVGEVMRGLGYEHAGQRAMPPGSVAKTGAFWRRR